MSFQSMCAEILEKYKFKGKLIGADEATAFRYEVLLEILILLYFLLLISPMSIKRQKNWRKLMQSVLNFR